MPAAGGLEPDHAGTGGRFDHRPALFGSAVGSGRLFLAGSVSAGARRGGGCWRVLVVGSLWAPGRRVGCTRRGGGLPREIFLPEWIVGPGRSTLG